MRSRPTNASGALALCAVGAGVVAMALTFLGWLVPVAVLGGMVAGICVYTVVLLIARQKR